MIQTILTIILFVVLFLIAWKLFKSILKALFTVLGLALLSSAIFLTIVYLDVQEVRSNFGDATTINLIENNNVVTSVTVDRFSVRNLENSQIIEEQGEFKLNFDMQYVLSNITLGTTSYTEQEVYDILIEDDQNSQIFLFALVSQKLKDRGFKEFVVSVKEDQITSEPELKSLNLISRTPNFIINRFS